LAQKAHNLIRATIVSKFAQSLMNKTILLLCDISSVGLKWSNLQKCLYNSSLNDLLVDLFSQLRLNCSQKLYYYDTGWTRTKYV